MNASNVGRLRPTSKVNQINGMRWYRAIAWANRNRPLSYGHTPMAASRYSSGSGQFPMLHFAPDRFTALLEMRALILASGFGGPLRIRAASSYAVVLVKLLLNSIIDFSDARQRALIETSVQELTGDWRTYGHHLSSGHVSTVRSNLAAAHTQALGQALHLSRPDIEGFLAPSAVRPTVSNLIVFPDRLLIDPGRLSIQSRSDDRLP